MNVLLVAATPFELAPTLQFLEQQFTPAENNAFIMDGMKLTPLVTGIGIAQTAWHLGRYLATQKVDLALNAGVAGSFVSSLKPGDVVQVITEQFGDLGVEEANGGFTDLFQLGLADPGMPPFLHGKLYNPAASQSQFLPTAHGLTVNRVHGTANSIAAIRRAYPDVTAETMEGAAFFFSCLSDQVPFLAIRSISNYVEPRNRANWKLDLAIENLNLVLIEMIQSLLAGNS